MSIKRHKLDLRFLLAAFLAVATTFFAANQLAQHAMARIDDASDEIAFDTAPSIQRLGGLRATVRRAEYLLGVAAAIEGPNARAAVAPVMAELGVDAAAFHRLPITVAEVAVSRELDGALADFQGAVQRTLDHLEAGEAESVRGALDQALTAADRVSEAAAAAIEVEAENGRALALRIKAIRRNANLVAWAANGTCLLFTVLAALLVRRQLRRYGALVEEHSRLQESRATELENFAGRAAHDILSPVATAQMSLAMAARLEGQDPRTCELVERSHRSLLRVRSIVDALLAFARAGASAEPGATADVCSVIEDVASGIRPAAEGAGLELQVECACEGRVRCSEGVLTSIVSNLMQNALKYGTGGVGHPQVIVRAQPRAGMVHVEVEDNGPGLPADSLERIFLPFVRGPTLGKEGLGLGLATVKRLCEAHGGTVGVRSVQGSGAVFWVELPLAS